MQKCCPICQTDTLVPALHILDYFLTQEEFDILQCTNCEVLITQPFPSADKMGLYYDSGEYFSHGGNNKGLIPKVYNFIKEVNIKNKYKQVTRDLTIGKVLDIGCGIGDFLGYCKKAGWKVSGLEPNEQARKMVLKNFQIEAEDVSKISSMAEDQFDLVTLFHVLEHVAEPKNMVSEILRILKPGGRLVIALPNNASWDAKYYVEYWAAWDVPRHLFHFNPKSISFFMNRFPLKEEMIKPMVWDAFYVSLLSEKFKGKSMPLARAAFRGVYSNWKANQTGNYSSLMYFYRKPI
ncbi:MAG: class I SAM-dependent methyltransferase [Bacteroidales bacterium]|nr:class I SAM-dependent methyltransferase [Bacteroidales bacterium]